MSTALILAHDPVSPAGPVEERLRHHGFDIDYRVVVSEESYRSPNVEFDFPDAAKFDLVVPLGSPWGAWDDASIGNWLVPEVQWVKEIVMSGQPMLGICFGGQLVSRALGGAVAPAPRSEIGWHTVWSERTDLVPDGPWFQFHFDRFEVPLGAVEIARNPAASQAFTIHKTLAVQFHPEITADSLVTWLDWGGWKSVEKAGLDGEVMVAQTRAFEATARERTYDLVDNYLSSVAGLHTGHANA
jgi:GMP synthase-like glutamine amidotransferase